MDFRRPTDSSSLATIANELSIAIYFGAQSTVSSIKQNWINKIKSFSFVRAYLWFFFDATKLTQNQKINKWIQTRARSRERASFRGNFAEVKLFMLNVFMIINGTEFWKHVF